MWPKYIKIIVKYMISNVIFYYLLMLKEFIFMWVLFPHFSLDFCYKNKNINLSKKDIFLYWKITHALSFHADDPCITHKMLRTNSYRASINRCLHFYLFEKQRTRNDNQPSSLWKTSSNQTNIFYRYTYFTS